MTSCSFPCSVERWLSNASIPPARRLAERLEPRCSPTATSANRSRSVVMGGRLDQRMVWRRFSLIANTPVRSASSRRRPAADGTKCDAAKLEPKQLFREARLARPFTQLRDCRILSLGVDGNQLTRCRRAQRGDEMGDGRSQRLF